MASLGYRACSIQDCRPVCLLVCLSACLSVCLSACLLVCLSVCPPHLPACLPSCQTGWKRSHSFPLHCIPAPETCISSEICIRCTPKYLPVAERLGQTGLVRTGPVRVGHVGKSVEQTGKAPSRQKAKTKTRIF